MTPVAFEGSVQINPPAGAPDNIFPVHAVMDIDMNGMPFFLTAWKPSYEDLQAINRGEPIYVKVVGGGLNPMTLFTIDGV